MENSITEKYDLFIDTLNLTLLPLKKNGVPYLEMIQNQLEELEGDYYTFLYEDFILLLIKYNYLPKEVFDKVNDIREKISKISPENWNSDDFINNQKWIDIRILVIAVFKNI